ncbi:MAG: hypothetical protein HGA71_09560 [Azonexaceae bacterium]|nr:hypothetical protein [Azonexaceae bacterium]
MSRTNNQGCFPAAQEKRRNTRSGTDASSPDWTEHLPAIWRDLVDAPLHFKRYSEYEISAERTLGYDADDHPCFTSHRFMLTSVASDDDEEFYEVVSYSEEMAAWRLRDERWLVFRRISTSHCYPSKGFYVLSPDMPR